MKSTIKNLKEGLKLIEQNKNVIKNNRLHNKFESLLNEINKVFKQYRNIK